MRRTVAWDGGPVQVGEKSWLGNANTFLSQGILAIGVTHHVSRCRTVSFSSTDGERSGLGRSPKPRQEDG